MFKNALFLIGLCFVWVLGDVQAKEIVLLEDNANNKITGYDFDVLIQEGPISAQLLTLNDKERILQLTEQVYVIRLVANQARIEGLNDDPLIQAEIQRFADRLLFEKVMQKRKEALPDFTAAAKERYLVDADKYTTPRMVDFSHLLIRTSDQNKVYRSDEEAQALALDLRDRARADEPFRKLVADYSEDPYKKRNKGRMGFMPKDKLIPSIAEAVFAMTDGEVSDPVKTNLGYHVIKVHRTKPEQKLTFDEAKEEIILDLTKAYVQTQRQAYFTELKADKSPKLYEKSVNEYVEQKLKELKFDESLLDTKEHSK